MRNPQRTCLTWLSLLGTLALALGAEPANGPPPEPARGTIRGVVRFTGKVPAPQEVTVTDGRTLLHNDLVVDAKTQGLRYVLAALADAPAQPRAEKAEPVLVDQKDLVFVPRVVAVRYGQAVRFDNSDLFNHSVLAASTLPENQINRFVLPGKPYEHVFAVQKHPIQIGCSLHPWMRAWVYVFPHPWFAVTDEKGRFQIDQVLPGRYTLWLRHADTGQQERRTVEVRAGKATELAIEWQKVGE
jgi:plastocyanin